MKAASFHAIADALTQANVRFILVGGLAVIAQGYLRVTRDADIVIELVSENILQAFEALEQIGYRPTVPITARQFSDELLRRQWRKDKHMQVLQFWSDAHPDTKLDIFIDHPFDFQTEWEAAKREPTGPNATEIRIASIPALIAMKEVAGRPQDLIDIEYLRKIQDDPQP